MENVIIVFIVLRIETFQNFYDKQKFRCQNE